MKNLILSVALGVVIGSSVTYFFIDWNQNRKAVANIKAIVKATDNYKKESQEIADKAELKHAEKQNDSNLWRTRYDRGLVKLRQCEASKDLTDSNKSSQMGIEQGAEQGDAEPSLERVIFNLADDHDTLESQRDYWRDQYDKLKEFTDGKP